MKSGYIKPISLQNKLWKVIKQMGMNYVNKNVAFYWKANIQLLCHKKLIILSDRKFIHLNNTQILKNCICTHRQYFLRQPH